MMSVVRGVISMLMLCTRDAATLSRLTTDIT